LAPPALLDGGLILAGGVHAARPTARPVATATTVGMANPLVSLAEDVVALALSVLAVAVPVVAALLVLLVIVALVQLVRRRRRRAATLRATGAPRPPAE
jgi:TRAP-type C4-dicarboxylate transport system permease small subunit